MKSMNQELAAEREVVVQAAEVNLPGMLVVPEGARGVVLFAHGSGSSRFSSRNRFVAEVLNRAGLGILLFDLLTAEEHAEDQHTRHLRFDIELLGRRLVNAVDWSRREPDVATLPVGLFGASTGAAAALIAAAEQPALVRAVVSRGGRPDLGGEALAAVEAPTLLIVGGNDPTVLELNEGALASLVAASEKRLEVVPGATHLFEEPGTLEQAADLAAGWFSAYLR